MPFIVSVCRATQCAPEPTGSSGNGNVSDCVVADIEPIICAIWGFVILLVSKTTLRLTPRGLTVALPDTAFMSTPIDWSAVMIAGSTPALLTHVRSVNARVY